MTYYSYLSVYLTGLDRKTCLGSSTADTTSSSKKPFKNLKGFFVSLPSKLLFSCYDSLQTISRLQSEA